MDFSPFNQLPSLAFIGGFKWKMSRDLDVLLTLFNCHLSFQFLICYQCKWPVASDITSASMRIPKDFSMLKSMKLTQWMLFDNANAKIASAPLISSVSSFDNAK
jgi:hypothetical protein